MVHEFIMKAVEGALKDHGVDWILREKYPNDIINPFYALMNEIELALGKVL